MSRVIGPVGVSLAADDLIETVYRTGYRGREFATLRIGNALGIDVADASPDVLRQIAAAADELADWREAQYVAAEVPNEVAAEDGVTRPVYVRYQRGPVAA